MKEEEIIKRVKNRGWYYNSFTAYLIEVNISVYQICLIYGLTKATACYWLHHSLSAPVNAFFLTMRKIYMMYGVSVVDLF